MKRKNNQASSIKYFRRRKKMKNRLNPREPSEILPKFDVQTYFNSSFKLPMINR